MDAISTLRSYIECKENVDDNIYNNFYQLDNIFNKNLSEKQQNIRFKLT